MSLNRKCPKCLSAMKVKFSTTELISGTMYSFLKRTKDYTISPDASAFMIHGTKGHANLEGSDDEYSLLEQQFSGKDFDITGIADVLEQENGKNILVDFKCAGSFKVAKALGFTTKEEIVETGETYKTGTKKGKPKTKKMKTVVRDDSKIDRRDWELQTNLYRINFEKSGFKIDEIRIQVVVRDGNTYIARSRGVFRNIYYFKIGILPDKQVLDYFERKRLALEKALKQGYWNEICTKEENWDTLRCQRYCEVAEYCKYGKYLKQEKEKEDMPIKGLSEVRRLPRLGKIRLGEMRTSKNGEPYPAELGYFKLDPQTPSPEENEKIITMFQAKFGKEAKSIKIMLPLPNEEQFFPVYYKRYGKSTGLKCKGDGEKADCGKEEFAKGLEIIGKNGFVQVKCAGKDCPYYKAKQCTETGTLQVLIPELPGVGVWQISTGSYNSIVNIYSCLDLIKAVAGRFNMIPLKLELREEQIHHDGKTRKHHILHIVTDKNIEELQVYATFDPAKALLELPEISDEKEDIVFGENKRIEAKPIEVEVVTEQEKPEPKNETDTRTVRQKKIDSIVNVFNSNAEKTPLSPESYMFALKSFVGSVINREFSNVTELTDDDLDRICDAMTDPNKIKRFISNYLDSAEQ